MATEYIVGFSFIAFILLGISSLIGYLMLEQKERDEEAKRNSPAALLRSIEREIRSLEVSAKYNPLSREDNEKFSRLIEQRNRLNQQSQATA